MRALRSLGVMLIVTAGAVPATAHDVGAEAESTQAQLSTEVAVAAGSFAFDPIHRGTWQTLGLTASWRPMKRFGFSAHVPWTHVALADGRGAIGLGDVSATASWMAVDLDLLRARLGLAAGLPTGSARVGIGAGHFEVIPFTAFDFAPRGLLGVEAQLSQSLSSGAQTTEPHGSLVAPHADRETTLSLAARLGRPRWSIRLGTTGIAAWASPMDTVFGSASLAVRPIQNLRVSLGTDIPLAGYSRFNWRSQIAAAVDF